MAHGAVYGRVCLSGVVAWMQETAGLISEKISRNKPIIITDIEPMAKGL